MSGSAPDEPIESARGRQRFPRQVRLLCARDYQRVFAQPCRSGDSVLSAMARCNELGHARLGLAISRKVAPRAYQRNRIKRLVREGFRRRVLDLPAVDFVFMARSGVIHRTNEEIRASVEQHIQRLVRLCANS